MLFLIGMMLLGTPANATTCTPPASVVVESASLLRADGELRHADRQDFAAELRACGFYEAADGFKKWRCEKAGQMVGYALFPLVLPVITSALAEPNVRRLEREWIEDWKAGR
jgi:hypothetical protein